MKQLFSLKEKATLSQIDKSEKELQQFICDNWEGLFSQQYNFIAKEFSLKEAVHPSGSSGRIDILAYNPVTKRIVVFELKKDYDKNVGHQAADYRCSITRNFSAICLEAIQKHKADLPNKSEINSKEVEIVFIAKKFIPNLISQAKTDGLITLIEYIWFENDLILFDYITNSSNEKMKATGMKATGKEDKIAERYKQRCEGKDWSYVVGTVKSSVKKAIEAIPFTKENADKLEALIKKATIYAYKRDALLERLEILRLSETDDSI
jgi:hypothetical protein